MVASSITLDEFETRMLNVLQPIIASGWPRGLLDEAARMALAEYSDRHEAEHVTEITLGADGREISMAALVGFEAVDRAWLPYDSADPWPPAWRQFEIYELPAGPALVITDGDEPQSGEKLRLWYRARQTMNGLDGASATTVPAAAVALLVLGAAGYACLVRAGGEASETMTSLGRAADKFLSRFRTMMISVEPESAVWGAPEAGG